MSQRIVSPCVGLCSTTVGDRVCRGCQRHDGEIREWFGFPGEERESRMEALDALRERVAGHFLRVIDSDALEAQMRRHRIRFRAEQPPLSQAVELLRVGRQRIRDLSRYGLEPISEGRGLTPEALHAELAEALMREAHHRREHDALC
ncbi:DUF1289 domain-containing protein [Litchfieldella qijiaojingensis]|uniref:DUF1289 domain-containing protein n=1 Tax=Litchfieldella qijiaojingensis TaxID=980347 RepID=A0ABQ2YBF6_9GAMM|nr:DUF1289 domain-containing protein [Halomonas qijiaojingensis]GGX77850.1 DUF1289 domain-containing protein [Halomonas qijiaojingensis]